ncbi:MAG: hypothetical protein J6R91_07095 [Bacteroidaceae bacterium]|nr:hypothetical protein [Bacteroidaceae bacterium]
METNRFYRKFCRIRDAVYTFAKRMPLLGTGIYLIAVALMWKYILTCEFNTTQYILAGAFTAILQLTYIIRAKFQQNRFLNIVMQILFFCCWWPTAIVGAGGYSSFRAFFREDGEITTFPLFFIISYFSFIFLHGAMEAFHEKGGYD